ncbi:MAG: glycosyltransferase [Flavobacteriaceae bacterium]|nr:glycosyltransferase [Flavobacteriaceae bacterium]
MKNSKIKVLILTYYWPPAGGSGVQRWLKFAKYLRDFDIEPIIYTAENPNYAIKDESLINEVPRGIEILKQPIFEPNSILSVFGSKNKKESAGFLNPNPSFLGKIMQYIRANYFIPDARKYWIKPSVRFLSKYIEKNNVGVVITTGPPHSLHLIGLQLKKEKGIKWISDFRDPWTEIDYFHQLPLTEKAKKKHHKLEKEVLRNSDRVIVVGDTMKDRFLKDAEKVITITNGFDTNENQGPLDLDSVFSMTHVGMMNADRNPSNLWGILKEICDENADFKNDLRIRLIGEIAKEVTNDLNVFDSNNLELIDYVSHSEVKKHQSSTQVLLLSINNVPSAKGIITGKIFEYLQAKRPILAIGPKDGDAAAIIENTNSGCIFGFENKDELKQYVLKLYIEYKEKKLIVNSTNIEQYHRKELTKKLADLVKSI